MNFRDVLHRIALLAAAISTGTIVLPDDVFGGTKPFIIAIAGLVTMVITLYLGQTTTGLTKGQLEKG